MPRRSCSTSSLQESNGKMFMRRRSVSKMVTWVCYNFISFDHPHCSVPAGTFCPLLAPLFFSLRSFERKKNVLKMSLKKRDLLSFIYLINY